MLGPASPSSKPPEQDPLQNLLEDAETAQIVATYVGAGLLVLYLAVRVVRAAWKHGNAIK